MIQFYTYEDETEGEVILFGTLQDLEDCGLMNFETWFEKCDFALKPEQPEMFVTPEYTSFIERWPELRARFQVATSHAFDAYNTDFQYLLTKDKDPYELAAMIFDDSHVTLHMTREEFVAFKLTFL